MKLAFAHPQLLTCLSGIQSFSAMKFEEMPDEVRGVTMGELPIFFLDICPALYRSIGLPPGPPIPWGLCPQTPGVWRFGPRLICSPRTGPRTALTGDAGSLAEDQPLDCGTAPVALQQSRILCHSAQKLALLRSLARRCAPLSLFECYKASRFDRTATPH